MWFGGLSLFTLMSVGLYASWLTTAQIKVTAGEAVYADAMAGAELLAANLRERELEVLLLSKAPHFVRGDFADPEVLASLERRRSLRSEFAWLGVADANGKVIQASSQLLVNHSVANRPWFIGGLKDVYVGDVHEALLLAKLLPKPSDDEPLRFVDFAAPIRNKQGQAIGVVAVHAHWRWVTETVEQVIGRRGHDSALEILIVSNSGNVLYPQHLSGVTQSPLPTQGQQRYAIVTWDDNQQYLTSQVAVDTGSATNLGWRIVVRQPLAQALAPVYATYWQFLLLALMAMLIFSLLAWRLAQSVSKPIVQLAGAARSIKQHQQARYPTESRVLEVAALSHAMQSMADSLLSREHELEVLNQTLEQQVAQRTAALAEANAQLALLATTDPLTKVRNRRSFDEKIAECVQLAERTGQAFALLLLDADHFKKVNDIFGHPIGDAVLQQIVQLIASHIRATDFIARYGGEEFAVILPATAEANTVQTIAEKIRTAIATASFPEVQQMTLSIGTAIWQADPDSINALIQRADAALYQAKALGRNRVVAFSESLF